MSPSDNAGTESLLDCLYDAVMSPDGFQSFIAMLGMVFQVRGVCLLIRNAETLDAKSLWLHGITQEFIQEYSLEFASEDMLAQHLITAPIARFYASNLDVPGIENLADTSFYRKFLVPQDMAYAAGCIVLREGVWQTELYLQRTSRHSPFSPDEIERLNLLVPHLQRAIQMRQRFIEMQFDQNVLAGGLDVLAMPTLLFDEYGRVAHFNRSAAPLLNDRSYFWLEFGQIQTCDPVTTRKLQFELGNAIRISRGDDIAFTSVLLLPRPGRMPLMMMLAPVHLKVSPVRQGAALLFISDPENTPGVTTDSVRSLFGLTAAEAELAVALCGGQTLEKVARERGTSIHTIRSQLKSLFNKTGTRRQADLVSLLLSSPAYFVAQDALRPRIAPAD